MKIICTKTDLIEGINIVQNAIMTKSANPFLEGILIEAQESLKFTGFNTEVGIECTVDADILEKGIFVLNAKIFSDIVKVLPDSEVSIVVEKNFDVHIEAEESKFDIRGLNAEGYPPLPEIGKGMSFNIGQNQLREMIKKTVFAVGVEQHRMILTGLLVECSDNEIDVVGIDGYRVAWRKEHSDINNKNIQVVVPGKTMNELSRILNQSDEVISAVLSSKYILFKTKKLKFISRILDGDYLAYRSLIPSSFSTIVTLDAKDFLECVERAIILSSEDRNNYVSLVTRGDILTIDSNSDDGKYTADMKIILEGSDINILFNPKYLLDALKAVQDEDKIKICFNSNVHPCVIKPFEGDNFIYMILPLRV